MNEKNKDAGYSKDGQERASHLWEARQTYKIPMSKSGIA
jgi:hypothetical protein